MKKVIINKKIKIVYAKRKDCVRISRFINSKSMENVLLKRSTKQIIEMWKNFSLAMDGEKIVGVVGFKVWPDNQPEIISLAVNDVYRGMGIGTRLIEYILEKIKKRGFKLVFALTTAAGLFEKAGFKKIPIKKFPLKTWGDCKYCPKNLGSPDNPLCDEVALMKEIG
ncbi:MAG: GNAT family N-acetyltransferase [Parcubacteria group bacterium]|jgi:amino-acid N-acetyltransferase